jgi:hypothetical protein
MIVPAMNIDEVYRQVMDDYNEMYRKAAAQSNFLRLDMMRRKLDHEVKVITCKTTRNNNWNIMFRIFTHGVQLVFYLRSNDKRGPVTYNIQFLKATGEKQVIKHNTHFFQRFNERLKLNLKSPADTIKHFFKYNLEYELSQTEPLPNGRKLVQFIYTSGIAIGWQDETGKLVHVKTFVSTDMLTTQQKSLADFIRYHKDGEQFELEVKLKHMKDEL